MHGRHIVPPFAPILLKIDFEINNLYFTRKMFLSQLKEATETLVEKEKNELKKAYNEYISDASHAFNQACIDFIKGIKLEGEYVLTSSNPNMKNMEYETEKIIRLREFKNEEEVFETFGFYEFMPKIVYINKIPEGKRLFAENPDKGVFEDDKMFETVYLTIIKENINRLMKEHGIDINKFKFNIKQTEITEYHCFMEYNDKFKFTELK
jgi:hypothetical protein